MKQVMVAAAFVLSCGLANADEKPAALPADLGWIPPNCTAFVHVRFGELWDRPEGKTIRDALAKTDPAAIELLEKGIGIQLSQIDRITVLLPDLIEREPGRSLIIRVTTRVPYDAKRVLSNLKVDDEDKQLSLSGKLFELPGPYLHLSGPTSLTFFTSKFAAIGFTGRALEPRGKGGLAPALEAANEKHQLVVALNPSQFRNLQGLELPAIVRPLLRSGLVLMTGDFNESTVEFNLKMNFDRENFAKQGSEAVEFLRGEAVKLLIDQASRLGGSKETASLGEIVSTFAATVKGAKIVVGGNQVNAKATLESRRLVSLVTNRGVAAFEVASRRQKSNNNLKQLALAMHNHAAAYGRLPAGSICDKNGKPLLSWRVAVLPWLEQDNLFRQFHFDEPWDSEHNKKLLKFMPKIYLLPGDNAKHDLPSTYYRVFVGNGAVFDWSRSPTLEQLTAADGTSGTLLITEAANPVPWTKPEELEYDPKKPPKFGFLIGDRCNFVFADGSPGTLKKNVKEQLLHSLIQWRDGQSVRQADLDK